MGLCKISIFQHIQLFLSFQFANQTKGVFYSFAYRNEIDFNSSLMVKL